MLTPSPSFLPTFSTRVLQRVSVPALALILLSFSPFAPETAAKGPPLATTVLETEAYAVPANDTAPIAVIPAGAEVELTGVAAPGFLGIYYGGQEVFVPAQYLSLGIRPGIDTAVAIEDTPLLSAPLRDADIRLTVPEGQTVLLTGASVDGFDAASYEGTGGWIDDRTLAR